MFVEVEPIEGTCPKCEIFALDDGFCGVCGMFWHLAYLELEEEDE